MAVSYFGLGLFSLRSCWGSGLWLSLTWDFFLPHLCLPIWRFSFFMVFYISCICFVDFFMFLLIWSRSSIFFSGTGILSSVWFILLVRLSSEFATWDFQVFKFHLPFSLSSCQCLYLLIDSILKAWVVFISIRRTSLQKIKSGQIIQINWSCCGQQIHLKLRSST